jgi:hypothetical protein
MQKRKQTILFFLLAYGLVASACAANRINLVERGTVTLERVNARNISVSRAYAFQDGDQLEISGNVKRLSSSISNGGHVDIAIVSPEGETLEQVSTCYIPRIIRRRGSREAFFSLRLPIIPPEGSMVRVAYHKPDKSKQSLFDCGENAAAPLR